MKKKRQKNNQPKMNSTLLLMYDQVLPNLGENDCTSLLVIKSVEEEDHYTAYYKKNGVMQNKNFSMSFMKVYAKNSNLRLSYTEESDRHGHLHFRKNKEKEAENIQKLVKSIKNGR